MKQQQPRRSFSCAFSVPSAQPPTLSRPTTTCSRRCHRQEKVRDLAADGDYLLAGMNSDWNNPDAPPSLDPATDHTLRLEPVFDPDHEQELRLESICVAGGDARVIYAGQGKSTTQENRP